MDGDGNLSARFQNDPVFVLCCNVCHLDAIHASVAIRAP